MRCDFAIAPQITYEEKICMKNQKTKISLLLLLVLMLALFVGFGTAAEGNEVEDAKASVLTYEGMLARTTGDSGIRSMFRIDRAALAVLEENGYTVEIGASMGVSKWGGENYNTVKDLTVVADAEKGYVCKASGTGTVVVYSSKEEVTYATNKYVAQNANEYKFAFTTLFSEQYENVAYYNAEFCYRGFVALTKDGVTVLNYVDADGEQLGNSISLYDIVKYFVSGEYTGEKAEEYATLPKFLSVVDAVEIIEYFPKDSVSEDKLLSDKATLHVTTNEHAFTVKAAREGFYAVKLKYNAKNAQIGAVTVRNNTASVSKGYAGRIFPDILTYGTTPTDFIVPDADKVGAYQPDLSSSLMNTKYWGEGILYVYLAAGDNSLSLKTDSSAGVGIYAMKFILVDELSLDDRTTGNKFTFENTGKAYNTTNFTSSDGALVTTLSLNAGVYRVSGLVQVAPNATFKVELLSGETVLGTASYKHPKSDYTWAAGSANFAPLSFGEEITVPTSGEYTVRVSASGSYAALSELYLTKVVTIPEAIGTPTVTVDGDGVASWEAVKGATAYEYKINGGAAVVTTSTNVSLENGDVLTVRALGNGKEYLDGAWSESVKYIQTTFTIDVDTIKTTGGLTLETEGTYKDYYLFEANNGADYIEFTVNVGTAGLYAVSLDAYTVNTNTGAAVLFMQNKTEGKNDGWKDHHTVAQVLRNKQTELGTSVGHQYLYEGENTLRFYLESGNRANMYLKRLQLSLYWEDVAAAKQIIAKGNVSDIYAPTGESGLRTPANVLYLRGEDDNDRSTANVALPSVSETADYKMYIVGSAYLANTNNAVKFVVSNGQKFSIKPPQRNGSNGDNHWGAAYLYEVGTLQLKSNEEYTLNVSAPNSWFTIHAIYLVKVGEYSGEKETLSTPVLSVSGTGTVSWDAIPNASGYEYILDGGDPVVTDKTSLLLREGQTFTVRAIGVGAYESSAYTEVYTYVPAPATVWEYDLSNAELYKRAETLTYSDGYLYMPAGEANYIEFTVNAAKEGLYDISYIGKAEVRGRLKHINSTEEIEDGWNTHTAGAEFLGGTTQADFTRATSQYLYEGKNTIRIYVYNGNYYASHIKIELAMETPENAVHMIVNSTNSSVLKKSADGDDGFNSPGGHGTTGMLWGRSRSQLAFTLPRVEEGGVYKIYAIGANASTEKVSFDLVSDGVTVGSTSFRNTKGATHYHQANLYEIGELTLAANTDYTLVAYPNGNWFGFHRFFFVKVGEVPNEMQVGDLSVDAVGNAVSAKVFLSGAHYQYLTMALCDAEGNVLRAAYREKSNEAQLFTLSLNLAEGEVRAFDSVKIFPTEEKNSVTPIDENAVYCYYLDNSVMATEYTADKESGEFSAKVNFTSFHYDGLALVLLNESGRVVASAHTEVPEYTATDVTLSVSVSPTVAATVAEMKVIVTENEDATEAASGATSFAYRFVNDLRLLFISDLHYNVMRGSTGRLSNTNGLSADMRAQLVMDWIIKQKKAGGVDAVFFLGDLTSSEDWYKRFDPTCSKWAGEGAEKDTYDLDKDGDVDLDDYYGSKYDAVYWLNETYLSQLEDAEIPVYCVPGNHDTIDNGHWERTFGYEKKLGYTKTEYIVKFPEHKTAVVMLNTFDKDKGAMDTVRVAAGNTYRAGTEQTLGYTPVNKKLLFKFLDELEEQGYESVYLAAHDMTTYDAALFEAAEKYSFITAYMYGDHHVDTVSSINGVPSFIIGHCMSPLYEWIGKNGETQYDNQRLPLSGVFVGKHGDVSTYDYYKMEVLHLCKDNYDFMSRYFTLTEVDESHWADPNTLILTRITNTVVSEDGKTTNTIYAGYYRYEYREDLSAEDRAIAERISYLIETYNMNLFPFNAGNTGKIPDGMQTTTETWWVNSNGAFVLDGQGRLWCYNDMYVAPNYTSFYKAEVLYKSYEIVDNGNAKLTYEDLDETTATNKK